MPYDSRSNMQYSLTGLVQGALSLLYKFYFFILRHEGGEKIVAERVTGTVKWFNKTKGFGFIEQEEGEDIFVHFTAIRGEGFRTLQPNDKVEFSIEDSEKGPQAQDVVALTS